MISSGQRLRTLGQAGVDSACWAVGLTVAVWTRYDFTLTQPKLQAVAVAAMIAAVLQNVLGHQLFLYRGRYAFGSFEEVRAVAATMVIVATTLLLADLLLPVRPVAASTPLIGGVLALVFMLGIRYVRRLERERSRRPRSEEATPALLFGAGDGGEQLLRAMLRDPQSKYLPVGLIDDDPRKRYLRISGVPVLGDRTAITEAVALTGARSLIFAVPSAGPELVREVHHHADQAAVEFKVLPAISELLDHRVDITDIRDLDVVDLLGRRQIETDLSSIAGYLNGKRVLITGAGGSIGSELCRQIHRFAPAEMIMLDRDESALHAVQLSLHGRALLDDASLVLADLRDGDRIRAIFAERRPQVVFHAAALKHLPLLERYPEEAVKTNVHGTLSVLDAAADTGVETFVNISTDKAADPCNVLGYSKRVTERLTAHVATRAEGVFLSVRFGNVLGSRGSALTAFTAQAAEGGPITVTHPEVSRYFMTIPEAVQLVIQAAAIGRAGEALVLDMGKPVKILEVARQVASQAPKPVDVVFTGLRPGEKLHEQLFGVGETDERPLHPLISHVEVPPLDPSELTVLNSAGPLPGQPADPELSHEALLRGFVRLCQPIVSASRP
jgi:FlaA1/EpsC-like NDP-sugar epimerase